MENDVKLIFNMKFTENDVHIVIEKVCPEIKGLSESNYGGSTLLYETKDGYKFRKANYFVITNQICVIPYKIKEGTFMIMYSSDMRFSNDEERKKFLNRFKNNLEEFSNSKLFGNEPKDNKVAFLDDFWIVY